MQSRHLEKSPGMDSSCCGQSAFLENPVLWSLCVSETIGGTGMKEPHAERNSNPLCPRVMGQAPQGVWLSVDRGTSRPAIEFRNTTRSRGPTGIMTPGRQYEMARFARVATPLRNQRTWHVRTSSIWELRDPCILRWLATIHGGGWRRCQTETLPCTVQGSRTLA